MIVALSLLLLVSRGYCCCLSQHGVFYIVSYGVPDNRLQYLENEDYSWSVTVHTVPKPTVSATAVPDTKDANSVHYIYVCQKGGAGDEG